MRLAGQLKMGYYPTPPAVVELIRKHIYFPEHATNVFDPCCGEGLALEALVRGTKAITYGIELDGERAVLAERRLKHLVRAGYEEVEVSPGSMGLLYLNPPYDDGEGERKELTFLRDTLDALAPGGTLVYIIPQARLPIVAAILASNFTQTRVYRFPDPEFEAFGQVVVFGRKTDWPQDNAGDAERIAGLKEKTLDPLPSTVSWPSYAVTATGNALLRFRTSRPEDLVKMAERSPLWNRVRDLVEPVTLGAVGQPPTRLHVGHLGLLLAAGKLNGLVGKEGDRHIVVGKPEKQIVESTQTEDDGKGNTLKVEKRLETFKVTIKMLLPTGEIRRLA